jgi:dihydrofolate synthase/folylpolyglutamate synthase
LKFMSYSEAIQQLNALVPELYTQPGKPRRKFSLEEIRVLLEALGNPQKKFPSVLIAGTNGKGSTAAALSGILREAKLRVGLYTSPHLERVNERIRVGEDLIVDDDFARRYFQVYDAAERLVLADKLAQMPSFFETLTAMAFLHFAGLRVEIAVIEVGMGGRLDATNIVDPLLSIITDISLDHTEWLGSTITAIAREKAGILRRGGTLITLPQHPEANQAIGEAATELGVRGLSATAYMPPVDAGVKSHYAVEALGERMELDQPLAGLHQQRNLALAIAAAVELAEQHGFPVTPVAISAGISRGTVWPGRLELIAETGSAESGRNWLLDVAHNPAGVWSLRAALNGGWQIPPPRTLIFSCLRDKPLTELAQILFPLFEEVIFAPINSARATPVDELIAAAQLTGTKAIAAASIADAIERAAADTGDGTIVISGSVYLVGEARPLVLERVHAHVGGLA